MLHSLSVRAAVILSALSCLLPSLALAQGDGASDTFDVFVTPSNYQVIPAGSNFDIIWSPSPPSGTITIRLMQGATEDSQDFGPTIATGIDSAVGKYTWSIPSSYGDYPTYGLEIQLDSNTSIFQYSYPFKISKATNPGSGASSLAAVLPPTTSAGVIAVTSPNSSPTQAVTSSSINQGSPSSALSPTSKPYTTSQSSLSGSGSAHSSVTTSTPPSGAPQSSPLSSTINGSASSSNFGSSSTSSPGSGTGNGSNPSPATSSTDLSLIAKVGIAIAVFFAACIITLLAYIALQLRRRHKLPLPKSSISITTSEGPWSELPGEGIMVEMEATEANKPPDIASGEKFRLNGDKFMRDEVLAWRRGGGNGRPDGTAESGREV